MWKKLKKLKHKQKEQNRIPAPESCFTAKSQHNATLLSCTLTLICHHRNCTSTFCTKQTLMNQSRVKISLQSFLKTNWLCQEFNALYLSTCKVKNRITPLRIKLDEHAFNLHKFGSHTISNIRIQQKDWSSLFVQSPRFVGSRHFYVDKSDVYVAVSQQCNLRLSQQQHVLEGQKNEKSQDTLHLFIAQVQEAWQICTNIQILRKDWNSMFVQSLCNVSSWSSYGEEGMKCTWLCLSNAILH